MISHQLESVHLLPPAPQIQTLGEVITHPGWIWWKLGAVPEPLLQLASHSSSGPPAMQHKGSRDIAGQLQRPHRSEEIHYLRVPQHLVATFAAQ